jgi:hypothetical protein
VLCCAVIVSIYIFICTQHSHLPYGIVNGFFCDDVLVASEGDAHACKDRVFSYVLEQRRKVNWKCSGVKYTHTHSIHTHTQ